MEIEDRYNLQYNGIWGRQEPMLLTEGKEA